MNQFRIYFTLFLSMLVADQLMGQQTLSEGTIYFDVTVQTGEKNPQMADVFDGAKAILSMRGPLSRSELRSVLGQTVTIYDHRAGTGVVLREYGPQKLLIRMNRTQWAHKNSKFDGIRFVYGTDTKLIAGFPCEKAEAILKDSSRFTVYFTRKLIPENASYDPQFGGLPGTALEYEAMQGNLRIRYEATKVSFDPVPMQRFESPKSGYRELTYEESVKKSGR
jgi:GLPGLI family protein